MITINNRVICSPVFNVLDIPKILIDLRICNYFSQNDSVKELVDKKKVTNPWTFFLAFEHIDKTDDTFPIIDTYWPYKEVNSNRTYNYGFESKEEAKMEARAIMEQQPYENCIMLLEEPVSYDAFNSPMIIKKIYTSILDGIRFLNFKRDPDFKTRRYHISYSVDCNGELIANYGNESRLYPKFMIPSL